MQSFTIITNEKKQARIMCLQLTHGLMPQRETKLKTTSIRKFITIQQEGDSKEGKNNDNKINNINKMKVQ